MILKPGQLFAGRYRIMNRLAEGGMGAVYVAVQEATELEVALKVLWPHVLERGEAITRFTLEAKLSARIRSEYIVQTFDAGCDQETQMPFLVMELLRGVTLQTLVKQRGPLPADEALELLTQVARGLDRAHAYKDQNGLPAPVIHRDLKPENLFVTRRETGEPLIKILDYGIAKVLSQATSLSREIKGTPLYMAYEQAMGVELSPQTDVWPLGLIAYFMLTGSNYWKGARPGHDNINSLLTEIVALPLDPPSARLLQNGTTVKLPAAFDSWFQRCVNRDPTARFESGGEAVRALVAVYSNFALAEQSESSDPISFEATLPSRNQSQEWSAPVTPSVGNGNDAAAITMSPASTTQSLPMQSRTGFWGVLGLAILGVVALSVFLLNQATSKRSADPMPATGQVSTVAPSAARQQVSAFLAIEPATASVKVNGEWRPSLQGKVELSGAPGTAFEVEATLGEVHATQSVKLIGQDSVAPPAIVLPKSTAIEAPKVTPAPVSSPLPAKSKQLNAAKSSWAQGKKEEPNTAAPDDLDPLAGSRVY